MLSESDLKRLAANPDEAKPSEVAELVAEVENRRTVMGHFSGLKTFAEFAKAKDELAPFTGILSNFAPAESLHAADGFVTPPAHAVTTDADVPHVVLGGEG